MKYLLLLCLVVLNSFAIENSISENQLHDVTIGMSIDEALIRLPNFIIDKPVDNNIENCFYLLPNDKNPGVGIMIVDETVVRIDIMDNVNIVTEKGIGIGASKQDVIKAYPQLMLEPHPYLGQAGEYLESRLPSGDGIIFETEFDIVRQYRFGRYPEVQLIEGCL